ncbi:MAG: hypothetical protein C0460_08980 [Methylibium sp.]|nr:hypothetical protein [Methylibium sp.]MBY0368071.1 response regulator [Burkholderiaceae bacterium]
MTQGAHLVLLGPRGTRWLFLLVLASTVGVWVRDILLGGGDAGSQIGHAGLVVAFSTLSLLAWRRPERLGEWQRWAVTVLALQFSLRLLSLTLRADPGPSLGALGSIAPWTLAGSLLLFTAWRPGHALLIAAALLALMLAPSIWLHAAGQAPQWLQDARPLLIQLALCQALFGLALWGLATQIGRLIGLAPGGRGRASANDLINARLAELEQSREAAEAASRAKSDFLATIGHEIRTPMNTVLGLTRLLLDGRLPAEQRNQLREVARAGETLLKLIDSMLDYADLDAGRLQLVSEPLQFELLLGGAFDAVRPAAQAKQLELLCEIESPQLLGAAGARRGDAARLTQLITELLVNAVKFTPAGQVRLTAALDDDGAWRLRVRDSGVGIAPEQLARLFTPFGQLEAGASRRFGGTGMGLAICRALVERMGGELTARSTPGRGSEFELRLPLPSCEPLPMPSVKALRSIVIVQATHSAGHAALLGLVQALAPTTRVEVFGQGAQALARLGATPVSQPHDLLIVDWVLPDMDGGELLAALTQAGPPRARRIMLLSAFDTPVLRQRAHRQGAQALCAKPLLPHTLRGLMDLDHPLPEDMRADGEEVPATDADPTTLISELDTLLGAADSDALALWEQHESAFIDTLPAPRAQALAGAMQRLDFEEAQAALRGDIPPKS